MKLVTFNIRYDCGQDGINNFDCRKPLILEKLRKEKPDIICFQEVLPHAAQWLKASLKESHYVVGCPRGKDLDDEQTCVAYDPMQFDLMKMDTFWLSETPCVPGSRYPGQSPCPRVCTHLVLRKLSTGQVFRLINTHLDHASTQVRFRSVKQIMEYADREIFFPHVPLILTGDFNALPDSPEVRFLENLPGVSIASKDAGITFHNFGRGPGCQIDYIVTRGKLLCSHVEKWTDCRDGVYLSDHYPVCAQLQLYTDMQ